MDFPDAKEMKAQRHRDIIEKIRDKIIDNSDDGSVRIDIDLYRNYDIEYIRSFLTDHGYNAGYYEKECYATGKVTAWLEIEW